MWERAVPLLLLVLLLLDSIDSEEAINIAIVMCSTKPTYVFRFFMGSLLANPSRQRIHLFIVIDEEAERAIGPCLPRFREQINGITLIKRDDFPDVAPKMNEKGEARYKCCMDKLLMSAMLPPDLDRVATFDVDTIILEDLQNLWDHWKAPVPNTETTMEQSVLFGVCLENYAGLGNYYWNKNNGKKVIDR